MTVLRRSALAALILAAPVAQAADKPKPAATKPAAKATPKPAAKPAPAKAPAAKPAPAKAASATPKPKASKAKPGTDIAPLSHAEKDGFSVLQVAAPDSARFIADWKLGQGGKSAATRTVANQPLFTFLIFRGCKANAEGNCDVVADFVIHRPDGTVNEDNKGVAIWNKGAPDDPRKPILGDGALGYGVDEEGPFGAYRVVVTVTDRVAGTTVTTEQTLTIAPFLDTPPVPATPATP